MTHPPDPHFADQQPSAEAAWDPFALLGVAVGPERRPDVVAFLADVRDAADALLALDLDDVEPGAVFDARWPEDRP